MSSDDKARSTPLGQIWTSGPPDRLPAEIASLRRDDETKRNTRGLYSWQASLYSYVFKPPQVAPEQPCCE